MTKTEIRTARARYTTAQTNTVHFASAADERVYVTGVSVTVGNGVTVNPAFLAGFASDGVTPTDTKSIWSHPGIAPGSGGLDLEGAEQGSIIHGATGDDILVTIDEPTTGAIDVIFYYYIIVD